MHLVRRGPEPDGLPTISEEKTPRWIAYYRSGVGTKPSDSHWRDFIPILSERFSRLCGYCEEYDKGEVDHFKPKSRFPELVYDWENWIFACHNCNQMKGEKWPEDGNGGYVDPCAQQAEESPEKFFEYDLETGEIIPSRTLDDAKWARAANTITDLQLNNRHHIDKRRAWLMAFVQILRKTPEDKLNEVISEFTSPGAYLSSWCAAMLLKYRPPA